MPDFHKAGQKYEGQVHFLMVNLTDGYQETVESASGFISKQGYGFPVYYDTDVDAAATYGVSAVPVTYFIDQNGYLIAYGQGALSASYLQKGIDLILPK
jgi:thiol-disulfide isomerase/thioredoxin